MQEAFKLLRLGHIFLVIGKGPFLNYGRLPLLVAIVVIAESLIDSSDPAADTASTICGGELTPLVLRSLTGIVLLLLGTTIL